MASSGLKRLLIRSNDQWYYLVNCLVSILVLLQEITTHSSSYGIASLAYVDPRDIKQGMRCSPIKQMHPLPLHELN